MINHFVILRVIGRDETDGKDIDSWSLDGTCKLQSSHQDCPLKYFYAVLYLWVFVGIQAAQSSCITGQSINQRYGYSKSLTLFKYWQMSTLFHPRPDWLCPLTLAYAPPSLTHKLSQKQLTPLQVISHHRELENNSKVPYSCKKKISISELKRSKEASHIANTTSNNYPLGSQKMNLSNSSVIRDYNWQSKPSDPSQPRIMNIARVQGEIRGVYENSQKLAFGNKIINRVAANLENKRPLLLNTTLDGFRNRMLFQERRQTVLPVMDNTRMIASQKLKPPIRFLQIEHQPYPTYTRMEDSGEFPAFMRSGKQTMISTNPSNNGNVGIRQAQSVQGESQINIVAPPLKVCYDFPQGFRNAQSLEDNQQSRGEISVVLEQYHVEGKQNGVQTERVSIDVREANRRQSETQRRSRETGRVSADI